MSTRPVRFLHASDLHLEAPVYCTGERTPEALRERLLEAPYQAAKRVFQAALDESVDFVVLAGDVADTRLAGPRAFLFLQEQFARLAEQKIDVYWARGGVDTHSPWPSNQAFPTNVVIFSSTGIDQHVFHSDGEPLARLIGASGTGSSRALVDQFSADATGLFTVGVAYGSFGRESLPAGRVNYLALGGQHAMRALAGPPRAAHYCGTSQGRSPAESGPHGCTLVEVDYDGNLHTRQIETDTIRWVEIPLTFDTEPSDEQLERRANEALDLAIDRAGGRDLLVRWQFDTSATVAARLRHSGAVVNFEQRFRQRYGDRSPAAWTVSADLLAAAGPAQELHDQETLLGDFLRLLDNYETEQQPLDLSEYLSEAQRQGELAAVARLTDPTTRGRVLATAAQLGTELLSPHPPARRKE